MKCCRQAEQIIALRQAFAMQKQQHQRQQLEKAEQLNALTSQLLLLEARLKRKQKHIAAVLAQRDLTIQRQQKIIDALSSRLVDHGLETIDPSCTDFDSLNDSDSAVVLEDVDSDSNNSSLITRQKLSGSDVTIVRSISDAIETNLKYGIPRRSNCFLRRPDILETVYSVEEDSESNNQQSLDVVEKRDKFKASKDHVASDLEDAAENTGEIRDDVNQNNTHTIASTTSIGFAGDNGNAVQPRDRGKQVTNYNRVMSNHRSVTKPKDVKYKRINKAKSKSLEELRGRLKHWVERGNLDVAEG